MKWIQDINSFCPLSQIAVLTSDRMCHLLKRGVKRPGPHQLKSSIKDSEIFMNPYIQHGYSYLLCLLCVCVCMCVLRCIWVLSVELFPTFLYDIHLEYPLLGKSKPKIYILYHKVDLRCLKTDKFGSQNGISGYECKQFIFCSMYFVSGLLF